ncbi:putative XRN 5' 3' exonuclease N terminus [Trypanosoma vivax]|uniref:5'-3' exoribonuclease 2 n=1 Tax=Trypanosoma vivax (strain Y486) TaxID=1055687 RepID=G0TYW6_TRYVY|nr:putative 5'-3' exonuclease XRNA [Trypanosoma vivax]KAH8612977.1 putative XRN 5' 3' exonuclease N terminus [Trypanosoma vivax]CCC49169.1 putative 5'-3' exonuclease XRNA [Trypanosoma vivax Y486]
MGVPKFFRWVAERYPSVIIPFRDFPPQIDNLYLDMNGIIHNCSHPNDVDAKHKAPTELEMAKSMFVYLEKLFNAIQPRKCFFLAVDGVAPRAKMNQQRQRRYRSGYELMIAREEALARGEEIPEEHDVFDSNCITPGTDFMVRISEHFQYFITMKVSTDPAWQKCNIIYSGHDHPGEGEHKIVDFIRRNKMQPGYSPNESHCMYGLDADLVMLALATHEPNFVLLREVVSFGSSESRRLREQKEADKANGFVVDKSYHVPDEFVLFHLNLLRDYLDLDLRDKVGAGLPVSYDFERVVDDFVLMCFFVGNDFLPSIPTLSINDGSLVHMLDIYASRVLKANMYLTEEGRINWRTVELWIQGLAELEFSTIKAREAKEKEYQRQLARRDPSYEAPAVLTKNFESLNEYKDQFYREKHGFDNGWDPQGKEIADLRLHYVEGLVWVYGYYYHGPPSWKWFFPHHYAPMVSDLVNLPAVANRVSFEVGEPFLPHQQLLAVLPPMSYRLLPRAYWPLLRSKGSPLARYFPEQLKIDREGARASWEGIVLIPFIDERTLLAAFSSVQDRVTPEDRANNRLGKPTLFTYDATMEPYELPNAVLGTLKNAMARRQTYEFPPHVRFVPRLCPGVDLANIQLEGFSSLRFRWDRISPVRESGAVTIFGMPTRGESLLLLLNDSQEYRSARNVANLVGQEVFVGFPHLRRARVESVSDKSVKISACWSNMGTFCGTKEKKLSREMSIDFVRKCDIHQQYMKQKIGILVKELHVLVTVNLFNGMQVTQKGRIVRGFSKNETCCAIPLVVKLQDVNLLQDPRYVERDQKDNTGPATKVIFVCPKPKSKVAVSKQLYGSAGVVMGSGPKQDGTFSVAVRVCQGQFKVPQSLHSYVLRENWLTLTEASRVLCVSSLVVRNIIGVLYTAPAFGSRQLGLSLVHTRAHLARVGYVKLVPREVNAWGSTRNSELNNGMFTANPEASGPIGHYLDNAHRNDLNDLSDGRTQYTTWLSTMAIKLVKEYIERFRPLVDHLDSCNILPHALEPPYFMTGQWSGCEIDSVLSEVESFIDSCGIRNVSFINASESSYTSQHLKELEEELDRQCPFPFKEFLLSSVLWRHLYFPIVSCTGGYITQLPFARKQFVRLGSRVVNCSACGAVPFGATGTVVRILSSEDYAEVVYDEPFHGGSCFDGRLRQPRGALSKLTVLLVLEDHADSKNNAEAQGTGTTFASRSNQGKSNFPQNQEFAPKTVQHRQNLNSSVPQRFHDPSPGQVAIPQCVTDVGSRPVITLTAGSGGICLSSLSGLSSALPSYEQATSQAPSCTYTAMPQAQMMGAQRAYPLPIGTTTSPPVAMAMGGAVNMGGYHYTAPVQPTSNGMNPCPVVGPPVGLQRVDERLSIPRGGCATLFSDMMGLRLEEELKKYDAHK